MNIQQHERIAGIKKFSRCLYLSLTVIQYFLWVLWPFSVAWLWVATDGMITLVDYSSDHAAAGFIPLSLITLVMSALLLLLIKVTSHIRRLISHFVIGDIFNMEAINHARKALQYALVIYGIYALSSLASCVYIFIKSESFHVSFNGNYIYGLIIFGLMYILLWTLEIGCDLHEESELTI